MEKRLRSCFIVDVVIGDDIIKLTDSSRNIYYIDVSDDVLMIEFKTWLKDVFMKGIAQTLTVLSYTIREISECETRLIVQKIFLNKENNIEE